MHDIQYVAIAHIQERGGLAALIDMGGTLEVERGKIFGVNFDELLVSQADTLYGALEIICASGKNRITSSNITHPAPPRFAIA